MTRICLFAVLGAFVCAALPAAETVEIYTDFRPGRFGQAAERAAVKRLGGFDAVKTLAVSDPDGVLTAVVLDARVVDALTSYLTDYRERRTGSAWMWLEEAAGRKIFHYYDDAQGLSFSFSAEKPNAAVLSLVETFYGRDAVNRREVGRHYRGNYVIRIHSAENIIEPWLGLIDFEEALAIATLIGDTEQQLWGIRDGKGLLRGLPALIAEKSAISLYQYRPIEKNETEYLSFVRRVREREGSFARNLRAAALDEFDTGLFYDFQLPEEFVVRGHGKPEELVLLYTDILVRMGFEARLLAVAEDAESRSLMVVFRDGGKGNWSALTEKDIFPHIAADWKRIPAAVFSGENIWYHEMDFERIFRERNVYDVPAGSWHRD